MVFFNEEGPLTNERIDSWSEQAVEAYTKAAGKRATEVTRLRLTLEEILLRFQDSFGQDNTCYIKGIKRVNGIFFEIALSGDPHNPLDIEQDLGQAYDMLARMNVNPAYIYRENRNLNVVSVPARLLPKKNAMLFGVLAAVALSVLTWILAGMLPDSVRDGYLTVAISKLFSKLSSVFAALATPLVFCAVVLGIIGLGDISSLGKYGGRLVKRMMLTYLIAMVAMLLVGIPQGMVSGVGTMEGESVFSDLLTLVIDIIPGNLIEPFRIDNDMQVIMLAIFTGVTMLLLGDKVRRLRSFLEEVSGLVNRMMILVCKLLPLLVYLGMSNLLLDGKLSHLASVSRIVVVSLAGSAITIFATVIRAMIVTGKPFKWLFKAQLPSLLINLTTSSQVSALPESMKCCKEKWGIDSKLTDFGLPFGIVFYMPNGAIVLGSIVWGLSSVGAGGVDPITLCKLVFVAVIVAIAAPPIPGSAIAVLPILFSACGTDLSLMSLGVIVASTVGYLLPAMNGYCLQLELLMCAWKSGCVKKA